MVEQGSQQTLMHLARCCQAAVFIVGQAGAVGSHGGIEQRIARTSIGAERGAGILAEPGQIREVGNDAQVE